MSSHLTAVIRSDSVSRRHQLPYFRQNLSCIPSCHRLSRIIFSPSCFQLSNNCCTFAAKFYNYKQRTQKAIEQKQFFEQSKEYWKKGDYDSFARLCDETAFVEKSPLQLKARNEKWLPRIKEAMKARPTMFVFGAGHLPGPNGVIKMLRKAKYKIKQEK